LVNISCDENTPAIIIHQDMGTTNATPPPPPPPIPSDDYLQPRSTRANPGPRANQNFRSTPGNPLDTNSDSSGEVALFCQSKKKRKQHKR
jgi:hypothetical protein